MLDLRRIFGVSWAPDLELQEDEWRREPPTIQQDRLSAEPRYAPPRVSWTNQEPTVPGLYFVRLSRQYPTRVVDVYRKGSRLVAEWSDIPEFDVAGCGYQFSDHALLEPR